MDYGERTTGTRDEHYNLISVLYHAHVKVTGATDEPSSEDASRSPILEVGQASSALIQLPKGGSVLIDGGPREGGPERVANLQRLGVSQLDAGEFG